jgi:hypothetical protein
MDDLGNVFILLLISSEYDLVKKDFFALGIDFIVLPEKKYLLL